MTYRWRTPTDWLAEAARTWTAERVYHELIALASKMDQDDVQDVYDSEMETDGYFRQPWLLPKGKG